VLDIGCAARAQPGQAGRAGRTLYGIDVIDYRVGSGLQLFNNDARMGHPADRSISPIRAP
jgi:hypothetical protein